MSNRPLLSNGRSPMNNFTVVVNVVTSLGAFFALTGMIVGIVAISKDHRPILPPPGTPADGRVTSAYLLRVERAHANAAKPLPVQRNNGDDEFYPERLGSFSKGLQHDALGQVDPLHYERYLDALEKRQFDQISLAAGAERVLANPQGGLTYEFVGGDVIQYTMPPAPAFNSTTLAAEYVENAWMAVTRDVPFAEYATNPLTVEAAAELDALGANFTGPRPVTTATLFRGTSYGCLDGPYLSQFYYLPMMYGMHTINMKVQPRAPGVDFMTTFSEYLNIQNGRNPSASEQLVGALRYMISGRDIANWVHVDILWQAYHMAALSLDSLGAPYNPTNPYFSITNQDGFATFGVADVVTKVAEVTLHALHAVKYQKWFVHRRMRPEVFGARIHINKTMNVAYPIDPVALDTAANTYIYAATGHYLLPQAFPEGSPMHPSYGQGHGTVAGACATVLKAFYDNDWIIPNPMEPDGTGATLVPIVANLTVAGEINKIANNVALGRDIAGVHWRSDTTESLLLGERVAIDFLRDYKYSYIEAFSGWRFRRFDGTFVII